MLSTKSLIDIIFDTPIACSCRQLFPGLVHVCYSNKVTKLCSFKVIMYWW